jgi:recombination protein RecR
MSILPQSVENLIDEFSKLPGVGPKSAQRLVFYLIKAPKKELTAFSQALGALLSGVKFCLWCQNLSENDKCPICANDKREKGQICVVEKPLDVVAIEETHNYNGLYHILHGAISPINGIGPDELKIVELLKRLNNPEKAVKEIIIATNPNLEGEATAMYLSKLIKPLGIKVSRIARGLPTGSDLDYADHETLSNALQGRKEF